MLDSPDSDDTLMQRIIDRDGVALAALSHRYHSLLMGPAMRILRDRADAEDVVQEVMTRVWFRAHLYDRSRGTFLSWALQITRNRSIDMLRCNQGWQHVQHHAERPAAPADAETGLTNTRNADTVRAALLRLPATQRDLLEHAFFQGRSHSQLADFFGLPLGTVKTRIRIGLAMLRRQLVLPVKRAHAPDAI